jgi:uncharacterized repeat protein (TIGR03803 family)
MQIRKPAHFRFLGLSLLASAMLLGGSSWASTEHVVYSFTGGVDGGDPASPLVFDNAGNAYGTTVTGGADGCGTVYILTPAGGGHYTHSVIFSFDCFSTGKNPYGGVTMDGQGNLYGTTVAGGSGGVCVGDGCGVVYELTQSGGNWSETVLYSFGDSPDAAGPGGGVVFDAQGNIYATAADGGADGEGAIYELSPTSGGWTERVIHDFTGGDDGALGSLGTLLRDAAGNFYGVTEIGGQFGAGTVYKLSPASGGGWNFATLYAFQGQPDAAFPYGGLIADANGNMYGTTYFGGTSGAGTVFKIGPAPNARGGWRDTVLYSFEGGADGGNPTSTLVFDAAHNLYGTTSTGGDPGCDCGVAFELSPNGSGWTENVLHTFGTFPDGASPSYGLTSDGAGNYLGATPVGGQQSQGTVYQLTP